MLKKTSDDGDEYIRYQKSFDDNIIAPVEYGVAEMLSNQQQLTSYGEANGETEISGISCSVEIFDDILISGFAAILAVFARGMGFFMAFESYLNVKMKSVDFTVQNHCDLYGLQTHQGY